MTKKVFFALLVGVILVGGLAFAEQSSKVISRADVDAKNAIKMEMNLAEEAYAVGSGQLRRFDATSKAWMSRGTKAATIDTVFYFTAEGPSWNDLVTGTPWDTVDYTKQTIHWHVSTLNACNGESSWVMSDENYLPGTPGYGDAWVQILTSDPVHLDPSGGYPYHYMTYYHWLRCEEKHGGAPLKMSWDGYQVQVKTSGDTVFHEIKPYDVWWDISRYGWFPDGWDTYSQYDSLWAWGYGGYTGGGFSQDTTGYYPGGCSQKVFDLRAFSDSTVQIRFMFGSDGAFNTLDDSSMFGLILDDITILASRGAIPGADTTNKPHFDVFDSAYVADSTITLFLEDAESPPHAMTPSVPGATGSLWHLANVGHTGMNCAFDALQSGPGAENYIPNMEDILVSPPIARADLDTLMAELWVNFWHRGDVTNDPQHGDVNTSEFVSVEYQLDGGPWTGISLLHDPTTWYVFQDLDPVTWTEFAGYSSDMRNLSPLLDTTEYHWDTLRVGIHFRSDGDPVTDPGAMGLQVDDVTLSGRLGFPFDLGVSALQIPSPNANGIPHWVDVVAVENYGFNTAAQGGYQVKMTILDNAGIPVFGPGANIAAFPTPQIESLEAALVPLDSSLANFTFNEEMVYEFYVWTEWTGGIVDGDASNDTLRAEYTPPAKAYYYPDVYNYPSGQGGLRYHDQAFYTPGHIWRRLLDEGEIAAVHFTPEERFQPFDVALAWFYFWDGGATTYDFHVYDSGSLPGTPIHTEQFTTSGGDSMAVVRIDLDTLTALQNRTADFWLGVEFPADVELDGMTMEPDDPEVGGEWGHSYYYEDTLEGYEWGEFENDWYLTAVIQWQIPWSIAPSLSGPPKNPLGTNIALSWEATQCTAYVYREAEPYPDTVHFYDRFVCPTDADVGAAGDPDTSYSYWYFYVVHQDGYIYCKENTIGPLGEFDKSMVNVK
jgi:hypothetical protein